MKFTPETLVTVSSSSGVAMVLEVVLLRAGLYFVNADGCPLVRAGGGGAGVAASVARRTL